MTSLYYPFATFRVSLRDDGGFELTCAEDSREAISRLAEHLSGQTLTPSWNGVQQSIIFKPTNPALKEIRSLIHTTLVGWHDQIPRDARNGLSVALSSLDSIIFPTLPK